MTTTDYLVNAFLLLLVLRQVRASRMTLLTFLLPIGIVSSIAYSYLSAGVPTGGHDLELVVVLGLVGAVLGTACAMATTVWRDAEGHTWSKAGLVAAVLWVAGIGLRIAFSLYTSHGGAAAITRFSVAHQITGGEAWTAALVIMSLAEVLTRVLVLHHRGSVAGRVTARRAVGLAV